MVDGQIPDAAVRDMPERVYAKTHGASTDVISGQRGLIGGWNEHKRDGQVEFIRSDVATLTNEGTKPVDVAAVREAIRFINIHDEADAYEWRGEGGDYTPKSHEKAMLEDFGCGLIGTIEDALRNLSAEPTQGEQYCKRKE